MPPKPLKDKNKYYPGSPWGDKPPEELAVAARARADQFGVQVSGQVNIAGLAGPVVEGRTPAGDVIMFGADAGRHVDAYFEYRQLVGDTDGGKLLSEADYEALRERAADPSRRIWAHWVESASGLECKAMGPSSKCFCGHMYREHSWDEYPETRQLSCKMRGCSCASFNYVPVKGSGDIRCSGCKQSYLDHDPRTRQCRRAGKGARFMSSFSCSCKRPYDEHRTVVQTNSERQASGKLTNAPWMDAATGSGLPTAHMGGIGGFTALADGIDRAMAGLEPGFEPMRIDYESQDPLVFKSSGQRAVANGPEGYRQRAIANGPSCGSSDRFVPRGPMPRRPGSQGMQPGSAAPARGAPKSRPLIQRPEWQE